MMNKYLEIKHEINRNKNKLAICHHNVKKAQQDVFKALESVCLTRMLIDKLQDELNNELFWLMIRTPHRKFMRILQRLN